MMVSQAKFDKLVLCAVWVILKGPKAVSLVQCKSRVSAVKVSFLERSDKEVTLS